MEFLDEGNSSKKESKLSAVKGVFKTFWKMTKEDWRDMDHRLLRIAGGIVSFIIIALLWYYVLRGLFWF